jgi:hypothetical protein
MDEPTRRPPASEAATMPAVPPPAVPTMDRIPALTNGPGTAASAVAIPPELAAHPNIVAACDDATARVWRLP